MPAGAVYVLTDIDGYLRSTGSGATEMYVTNPVGGFAIILTGPSGGSVIYWRGRQAFKGGQTFTFHFVTPTDLSATGFAFDGISPHWT